jgi:tRNA-dihydrouridine synthase B
MANFAWSKIQKPVVVLAPMADITTLPFRSICKEFGADIVYTPMFSANAIIHNPEKTLKLARFLPEEQPVIVQIFGYDGDLIAKAANIVKKKLKPAGIDINMGCPAPKITGNECGSALLRDYDKALNIAKKVREQFDGQLSVKVRLGWHDYDVLPFLKELERLGIDAISVHGRTTKQRYSGAADWAKISEIALSLTIPVIGNGDIDSWQIAEERLETPGIAGIMIGRGCLGKPWLFQEIKNKETYSISGPEIAEIIEKQASLATDMYGETTAIRGLRKHLGWYLKNFTNAKSLRKEAMQITTFDDLTGLLNIVKTAKLS